MILDLGLPGLGGNDVLEDLRDANRRLPVPILVERGSLMEREACLYQQARNMRHPLWEASSRSVSASASRNAGSWELTSMAPG